MKRKKLKEMLEFFQATNEEMDNDDKLSDWSAEQIFETANEITMNEFTASGTGSPVATVDTSRFAFCLNDDPDALEVAIIHGEDMFDD